MFQFLRKHGLWAAVVLGVLGGMFFAHSPALAQGLTSPHLADLKKPDTSSMRKYVTDASGSVSRLRNTFFANEDANRDVMHDLADGTKSYINQAKIAAEACDRAAYDAAIAKINAWGNTLDGLIADAEKTMQGLVGPGSIELTMEEVSKPYNARAKSLRRRRAAAQERLDAAIKANNLGTLVFRRMAEEGRLPPDVAGPYNEVNGYNDALTELSDITLELNSLASYYRRDHEFGQAVVKTLNEWKAKLDAERAGIPPFPEDCGGTAGTDTRIGLGGNQSATDTNGVTLNGGPAGQAFNPPSWVFNAGADVGELDRGSTGTLGYDNGAMIAPGNLLFLDNEELVERYFVELAHWFLSGGGLWGLHFGFIYGMSDVDQLVDRVSPGAGNNLLIFSPQGIDGGLGGGLNAGARDAVGIHHSNDNDFHEFNIGGQTLFSQGTILGGRSYSITGGPTFAYGQWDLDEAIHGSVEGINQTFAYHNMAEVTTYSFGGQVNLQKQLGTLFGAPATLNSGLSFERQHHDFSGYSKLALNGVVDAVERQNFSGDEWTNRWKSSVGVSFELTKQLDLTLGGSYQSYATPEVQILPNQVADVNLGHSNELSVFARMVVGLGPKAHESPALGRLSDRRLKRDIAHLATLANGIRLYSFKYLWSDQVHVGAMAQDLLADEKFRDAVVLQPSGFYAVDYARLGLTMTKLDTWREYGLAAVLARPAASQVSSFVLAPVN